MPSQGLHTYFSSVYVHPRIYIPFLFHQYCWVFLYLEITEPAAPFQFFLHSRSALSQFLCLRYLSLPFLAFVIHIRSIRQAHNFYIMPFRSITFVITLQSYNYINVLFFLSLSWLWAYINLRIFWSLKCTIQFTQLKLMIFRTY